MHVRVISSIIPLAQIEPPSLVGERLQGHYINDIVAYVKFVFPIPEMGVDAAIFIPRGGVTGTSFIFFINRLIKPSLIVVIHELVSRSYLSCNCGLGTKNRQPSFYFVQLNYEQQKQQGGTSLINSFL